MPVPIYTKSGTKSASSVQLDKKIFNVEVKSHSLIKLAYQAYLANGRLNLAKTKKRGEVRGGGRKPIRQKGTGYARVGSRRNPLQTGGGVTFGPSGEENYTIDLNRQVKRQALHQALTLAAKAQKIAIIDDIPANGKTKDAAKLLAKVDASGRTLLVVDHKQPKAQMALRNLNQLKIVQPNYLNVYDVINADKILFTRPGLEALRIMEDK